MRTAFNATFKNRPREPKRIRNVRMSSLEDKLRRHRNKKRIWRRCVSRLNQFELNAETYDAASLEAAS